MATSQVKVEKTKGVQPQAESRMIGEGGLGAETYYEDKDESGLPIHESLNELIANQAVFYIKLHQYHWHVEGHHFFTLHEVFEQAYRETTAYMDAFAERLIAKQVRPLSTMKEFLSYASIEEEAYLGKMDAEEMVNDIIGDFSKIRDLVKKAVKEAEEAGDDVTEDMLIDYNEYIDKTVWGLSAYIG